MEIFDIYWESLIVQMHVMKTIDLETNRAV